MKADYIMDGQKIRGLCEKQYITKKDLQNKAGLSDATIRRVMGGAAYPATTTTAFRIAEVLGADVAEIAQRA